MNRWISVPPDACSIWRHFVCFLGVCFPWWDSFLGGFFWVVQKFWVVFLVVFFFLLVDPFLGEFFSWWTFW